MEKLLVNGVEIEFNDLSLEVQEKLYLQNKAKFQKEAAKSKYAEIRRAVLKDKECEASTLDEIFKVETKIYGNVENLKLIWNHPKFEKTDEKRKKLSESDSVEVRMIVVKDIDSSSEFLNQMLCNEVQNERYQDVDVENAILNNPKFQIKEETLKVLAKSENWEYRLIAAKREETSSESLNEMLRNEVQNEEYQDDDVMNAILENSKFKMDDETRRQLIDHKSFDYRQMVIKDAGTSKELLEEMYLNETDEKKLEMIEEELFSRFGKKTVTLDAVQKKKILKVLNELKHSKERQPLSNYLEKILEIIA